MNDSGEPMAEGSDDDFEDLAEEDENLEREIAAELDVDENQEGETATELDVDEVECSEACASATSGWSSRPTRITINSFSQPVGPTFVVPKSPGEVFTAFFTDEVLQEIVDQTNLYAGQVMDTEVYLHCSQVTVAELKAYLGFNILMGLVQMPEVEDYWKMDEHFHYAPTAGRISCDRFREISIYLHFSDNTTLPKRGERGYDRLGKVRSIIQAVSQVLTSSYNISRDVVVDEAMIPFQGRSSLKQYLPKKPIKRGIKVWCLADSTTGYIRTFDVYTGKGDSDRKGKSLGSSVVLHLSQDLEGRNHHLYCDNYFTSVQLFKELLEKSIYACGTVRQSCKSYPQNLKAASKGTKQAMAALGLVHRYVLLRYSL